MLMLCALVFWISGGQTADQAAPVFTKKLPAYQGILYTSKHVNLTCIVECYPECSILWYKDGVILDVAHDHLYTVENHYLLSNLQKNDLISVNSTLIWNMTAWPGQMLDRTSPNSNYTCQATSNEIGQRVSSTVEIAVEYPPEDITTSAEVVNVMEGEIPSSVKCAGKGRPALMYQWKKDYTSEAISTNDILALSKMTRSNRAAYICEASNKHGSKTATVYFNVLYSPECTITTVDKDGTSALMCTALANPKDITFTWRIQEGSKTFNATNNIIQDEDKSYLILDSNIEAFRTYYCLANNSIGFSTPCQREVAVSGLVKLTYSPSTVVKGRTVTLTCNIESDKSIENMTIRWYRGHHRLPINESSITIDPVNLESRSNYSCEAIGEEGSYGLDTASLDVKASPSFLKRPPRFVGVMYTSTDLSLTCIVECIPKCFISWFKDGQLLNKDASSLYMIETKDIPPSVVHDDFEAIYSKLSWHMTGAADKQNNYSVTGNYTCQSTANEIGSGVKSSTEVFVRGEQAN